jgi:4a-hydroxytetrahydrobiopterin dehydratase
MELSEQTCVPCRGGTPPLAPEESQRLAAQVEGWTVVNNHHIEKAREFPDFKTALAFVNAVGAIAEAQNHHPDIYLAWGHVRVTIWTHKIDGLTESDFVLAAKIDRV